MAELSPEVPGIRPETLARRQPRTDAEPDMTQFNHVMSKKLADQLDARCREIGGLSRRALMNVILWEAMNDKKIASTLEETEEERSDG